MQSIYIKVAEIKKWHTIWRQLQSETLKLIIYLSYFIFQTICPESKFLKYLNMLKKLL